jgi:L-asparaginase/Glu-tRNA(Gln) amidotransferase subunit D
MSVAADDHLMNERDDPLLTELQAFRALLTQMARPPLRITQNALARSMDITSGYLSQALKPTPTGSLRVDVIGRAVERARSELERRAVAPDVPAELLRELREELQRLSGAFPYHPPKRPGSARRVVAVVTTGGTISLTYDQRSRRSVRPPLAELEARLRAETSGLVDLRFFPPPWNTVPENSVEITPAHWVSLTRTIYDALEDPEIDGVVVTHGLDTMTFSATATSFALGDIYSPHPPVTHAAMLPKPVVFTGAQYPWGVPNNDAESNVKTACLVASSCNTARHEASGQLATVLICMHNSVLSPTHTLTSVRQGMTEFVPLGYAIARVSGNQIVYTLQSSRQPSSARRAWVEPDFGAPIRVLHPLPGDEFWSGTAARLGPMAEWLQPGGEKLAAVAIIAPGTGAIPVSTEHTTRELLTEAARLDIPVFIGSETPTYATPPDLDATIVSLTNLGATPMLSRTKARLVVKLRWAASGQRPADQSWRHTVIDRMKSRHPAESVEL